MNEVIFRIQVMHTAWVVTPWKLIGYTGVALFAGRWLVQLIASHRVGHSHLPKLFWRMSLLGSLLLLAYFSLSDKNDSVGVLSNLFPAILSAYNLILEKKRFHQTSTHHDHDHPER